MMLLSLLLSCSDYGINAKPDDVQEPDEATIGPVAITGPGDRIKRYEEIALDGSSSYDPDDEEAELLYSWTVNEAPADALVTLSEDFSANPVFTADTIGEYTIGLVVIDAHGFSSTNPAATVVEIGGWESLEISLTWNVPDVDLDLHLVAETGVYFGEGDCFFGDPNPDWGAEGVAEDDPLLQNDNEDGTAAEVIFMDAPGDGLYTVYVHHFSERDAVNIYATPSLEVYGEGVLIASDEGPKLYGEGKVWVAGTLDWSTMTWTGSSTVANHESLGGPDYNE